MEISPYLTLAVGAVAFFHDGRAVSECIDLDQL